ncbi:hypothetical protein CAMRE0001_2964 [Campylobacter rectus RM3267]|uniref:Uncharacterized protein n=1 Tax=Campylobacter rectus RM3267 TaxID=553218 RepID=B9D617_CAMRE|nr:hypothetical protein CAMRE0001_2964 [Campylobacter rectus RM3267]
MFGISKIDLKPYVIGGSGSVIVKRNGRGYYPYRNLPLRLVLDAAPSDIYAYENQLRPRCFFCGFCVQIYAFMPSNLTAIT